MQFKYMYEISAQGEIDIEDIGNVCISAINTTLYREFILIIHTEYGKSKIIQYGPRFIDLEVTPTSVHYSYSEIDYKTYKLEKIIDSFLNNPAYNVSQVQILELEEAMDRIKDLREFL